MFPSGPSATCSPSSLVGRRPVCPRRGAAVAFTEVARERDTAYDASTPSGVGSGEALCEALGEGRSPVQEAAGGTAELAEGLTRLRAEIARLTDQVPDRAVGDDVTGWLDGFRRIEGAVAGLRARLIACAQASRTDQVGGHASTASLLREHLGMSGREAGRQDALARDLRDLPRTQAALQAGELGPEQAQAISRAARRGVLGDPAATEQELLPSALDSGADELRRHIRDRELAADRDRLADDERLAHRRRRASLVRREDGMWDLYACLVGEDGEALATAIDAHRTLDQKGTPTRERRTPEQRTADALSDVVRAALGGPSPRAGGVRPHLNVVIPVELITGDTAALGTVSPDRTVDAAQTSDPDRAAGADPTSGPAPVADTSGPAPVVDTAGPALVATTAHGGVLSSDLVARLLCDADLRGLVRGEASRILDVGRTRQTWTVPQRQALLVRDGGCRGPGCDRPAAWCDAHHVVWWTKGGPTSVDNGILLCRVHHRLVHEGGWTLRLDPVTGEARFRSPRGEVVCTRPRRPADTGRAPP